MSYSSYYGTNPAYDPCGCCTPVVVNDVKKFSTAEKLCYIIDKMGEVIEVVNSFADEINKKEDSINITNNRKLSESGDFTGTWFSDTYANIAGKINSNTSKIDFLTDQFEGGATGQVIDGGIAGVVEIDKNFDGGVV